MMKIKKLLLNWRVLLLLTLILFSVLAIKPRIFGVEGVEIHSMTAGSSAADAGMINPDSKITPTSRERIISVNGIETPTVEEYYSAVSQLRLNNTVRMETNKQAYTFIADSEDLGLKVKKASFSNLRMGLDLEGGTRVLLQPESKISEDDLQTTVDSLKERLNVYGLRDIVVRSASDLEGNDFILIEIAGVTEDEIQELLAKQGKFEAKIGNETVFFGGEKDITYVCRSAECSGIDPRQGCGKTSDGYGCGFSFQISLSPEAAARQAAMTKNVNTVNDNGQCYLSESLVLYL
ncbi:MAG: hypothetical protein AABX05_05840, partial [Nanoarchaeota archaeon]